MSDKNIIPPTPTVRDYTQSDDYAAQANANSGPIFDRTDPFDLFTEWFAEARTHEINDSNAMSLATVDKDGMPDVRMVLLKDVDARGFVFYTNGESTKGVQLFANPRAALCLHWKSLRRQVRVRGQAVPVSDAEADAYFSARARGSQIGAWASDQSRIAQSQNSLKTKVKETEARFDGQDIPRPPHWHGWRIVPDQIEFWRDQPFRLHDRLVFTADGKNWRKTRLYP